MKRRRVGDREKGRWRRLSKGGGARKSSNKDREEREKKEKVQKGGK